MANILVLDDDTDFLEFIRTLLRELGHDPHLIARADYLFQRLREESPDVLLMDIHMPGRQGTDLLKELKTHPAHQKVPVIMLTADVDEQYLQQCLEEGASDFINKPVSPVVLTARLNSVLRLQEHQERLSEQNRKLEAEILRRRRMEEELRRSQHRLARLLDYTEDAIISADDSQKVLYFNRKAEHLLGYTSAEASGRPLQELIVPENEQPLLEQTPVASLPVIVQRKDQTPVPAQASLVKILSDEVATWALILRETSTPQLPDSSSPSFETQTEVVWKLEQERQKLQALESVFDGLFQWVNQGGQAVIQEIKNVGQMLEGLSEFLSVEDQSQELREALVTVMSLALQYWEQSTELTKIELAEESGLWRASLDRGTFRVKTLDRYLKLESLPQNPRWKDVVDTGHFVLKRCPPLSPWEEKLEAALQRLQTLLNRIHRS